MMKLAVFATLLAGASAFAPVAQKSSSSALKMAFEDELGAQPPLGFFDRTFTDQFSRAVLFNFVNCRHTHGHSFHNNLHRYSFIYLKMMHNNNNSFGISCRW